ncbi:protein of unknown function DUF92 transmembrane [Methanofollis liminatans DSM 4140]|uniref:TIGR00297 family protein n=1 Tax=Methanofollis liminatans DSM 4140 TaxID=28892 RepID=J0RZ19_9EURY|nr:DUF92 domain-containing protein [Methanofollis liminatans]EJG06811.1 protein of unknown function DUF92 transmembrane [Methanofollis liminatans DSM 4140]
MIRETGPALATVLALLGILIAPLIQPAWLLSLLVILFSGVLLLIKGTRYASISIIVIAALYGLGLLSLAVFAATLAIVVIGEFAFRLSGDHARSYVPFILTACITAVLAMWYVGVFSPLTVILGVLVAVLLRAALNGRDDTLMIEGLGVAMAMQLFYEIDYSVDLGILTMAAVITLVFVVLSYRFRVADLSGLFSAAIIGILLIVFADVRWFLIMLLFMMLGSLATKFRYREKDALGVAQSHGGVRGYFNVFANGLVGTAGAVLFGITGHPAFIALFLGSVASAAADTVASEIGVMGGDPYLITTLERVRPGTNGGVTVLGEGVALAAAVAISLAAWALGVVGPDVAIIGILAGFFGTNVDSLVGATLENKGVFGNAGTNLVATLAGGIFALVLALLV